jgi:hypothetical protein
MVMGVKTVILCTLLHFTELKQEEHSIKIDPYRITSTGETNKHKTEWDRSYHFKSTLPFNHTNNRYVSFTG